MELTNGEIYRGKRIISNATRWDTFGKLVPEKNMPPSEMKWRSNYQKSPSFLSLHLGVEATVFPQGTECHHILLENWEKMEAVEGTIFVSIPTLLDPSLAPEGYHIVHTFTPSYIKDWQGLSIKEYEAKKEAAAGRVIERLENIFPVVKWIWKLVDKMIVQWKFVIKTFRD